MGNAQVKRELIAAAMNGDVLKVLQLCDQVKDPNAADEVICRGCISMYY